MASPDAPRFKPFAAALAVALVLPFNALAADPTPDPAEPYAKFDPQPRGCSVSSGLGLSRRLPSGSVTWHSVKIRAVQAAHLAASSFA
jgi:hypothetical protein